MKEFLKRVGSALSAGGAMALGTYATGHDVKAAVVAGLTTAVPLIIYGAHSVAGDSK